MQLLKYIQTSRDQSLEHCGNCKFFNNQPQKMEEEFAGLTTLSSGYGSVRHQDGICNKIKRYLSFYDSCSGYAPKQISNATTNHE